MKVVIVAFVMVMMLAGGVVSVMKWLKMGPFVDKAAAEAAEAAKPKPPPRFVDMPQIAIPIIEGERTAAIIQFEIKLEVVGDDNVKRVEKLMPILGDAFLRDLYGFVPRLFKLGDRLDLVVLGRRLKIVGDKASQSGLIAAVLFQSIVETATPGAGAEEGGPAQAQPQPPAAAVPAPPAAAAGGRPPGQTGAKRP